MRIDKIGFLAIFILFSCQNQHQNEAVSPAQKKQNHLVLTKAQFDNAGITFTEVETKTLSSVKRLNGKTEIPPQKEVTISLPYGGFLKSTKLLKGMLVKRGEKIAIVEDPQYIQLQQDYLIAKAEFALYESEFNRQQELNESKASSDKELEYAGTNYVSRQVLMKSLEQKLRLIGLDPARLNPSNISAELPVYAPISGYVSGMNANIGKYLNPGEMLFSIISPDDLQLVLTVFDKDIGHLAVGQKLVAFTNTQPQKKMACTIFLMDKVLSSENSAQLRCRFDQADPTLIPGMFMNAEVEIAGETVPCLPDEAIVRFENKTYAFVRKGELEFEMLEIVTGKSENGFTEIEGVENGNHLSFVAKGAYTLLMALKNTAED